MEEAEEMVTEDVEKTQDAEKKGNIFEMSDEELDEALDGWINKVANLSVNMVQAQVLMIKLLVVKGMREYKKEEEKRQVEFTEH